MEKEQKKPPKKCYECGKDVTGKIGKDFHIISSHYGARYYCLECIRKLTK